MRTSLTSSIIRTRRRPELYEKSKRLLASVDTLWTEIEEANNRYRGNIVIQETPRKGWGLFTLRPFDLGELVMQSTCIEATTVRNSHSVQIDWERHVMMDLPARFINHSCDPNVGIKENSMGAFSFYAMRDISKDEELLWDYETTEYEMKEAFECTCGSPRCRGKLRGFRYHADKVIECNTEEYVASFLLRNR